MPAVWTETQIINNLLRSGTFWTGPTITFGFPTSIPSWATGTESSGFSTLTVAQKTAATLAISMWDDLIAPSLVLTTTAPQITLQNGYDASNSYYAYSYFPGNQNFGAGAVFFNNHYDSTSGTNDLTTPKIGSWGFLTYLHELGHAFGLEHPGSYNGGNPTYAANAAYTHDSIEYSVMSYFGANNTGADWLASDNNFYYPQTLMIDDVAAIQQKYGADLNTRSGNTTYGFNSSLSAVDGGIYDFTQNKHPIMTIWDGAGNDTLDLSGFTTASRIDLHAGTSSDCDAMTNNVWIAYNCSIENAVGGSAADNITGNDLANALIGNDGADIISAAAGDDQIIGGAGNDTLTGGLGNDMFIFSATDVAAGQADTITDFTHDASGAGDTIRLVGITAQNVSAAMSGANAIVSYGNGTIVDTIIASAAGTNPFYVSDYSSLANAQANILANGFIFVSDAMNQAAHTWSNYLQTFDSNSVLDTQSTINDNGTRFFIDFDNVGNQTWTTITDTYDSLNRLANHNTQYDNGSRDLATYDLTNQAWTNFTDSIDALGRLSARSTYYDNGFHTLTVYDNSGQLWSIATSFYNPANQLDTVFTLNDDKTNSVQHFDTQSNQSWTNYTDNIDVIGRLSQRNTLYDNGFHTLTAFDNSGQTWNTSTSFYNPANQLDTVFTLNDDSSYSMQHFDVLSNQGWTNYTDGFDNLGRLSTRSTVYDNGMHTLTMFDNLGQAWDQDVQFFNSGNQLLLHIQIMHDGTTIYI